MPRARDLEETRISTLGGPQVPPTPSGSKAELITCPQCPSELRTRTHLPGARETWLQPLASLPPTCQLQDAPADGLDPQSPAPQRPPHLWKRCSFQSAGLRVAPRAPQPQAAPTCCPSRPPRPAQPGSATSPSRRAPALRHRPWSLWPSEPPGSLTTPPPRAFCPSGPGSASGSVLPGKPLPAPRLSLLTWGLRGARLQVAGLSANRLHQWVAAPDDVGALVALHVSHPHAHPAGLGALTGERRRGRSPAGTAGVLATEANPPPGPCLAAESPPTGDTRGELEVTSGGRAPAGNRETPMLVLPRAARSPHLQWGVALLSALLRPPPAVGPSTPAFLGPGSLRTHRAMAKGARRFPTPVKSYLLWANLMHLPKPPHPHGALFQMFPLENPTELPEHQGHLLTPSTPLSSRQHRTGGGSLCLRSPPPVWVTPHHPDTAGT